MTYHVYTRIVGFGLAIVPRAPFVVTRSNDQPDAVDIVHSSARGEVFAQIIPTDGGYKSKIDQHTQSVSDVLDVDTSTHEEHWQLQTTVFTCEWPDRYSVHSNNFPADPSPFDLVGPKNEFIFVQASDSIPDLSQFRAPYQEVLSSGEDNEYRWIDLAYEHGGVNWQQRHTLILRLRRRVVVTVQAPKAFADQAVLSALQVADSMVWSS